jgi:SnoaL-like protein
VQTIQVVEGLHFFNKVGSLRNCAGRHLLASFLRVPQWYANPTFPVITLSFFELKLWRTAACRASVVNVMTTQEVANQLVKLCSAGKFQEAAEALYSPDIVSMEAGAPPGGSRESKGLAAVKAKGEWWVANHEVHSSTVEGPLVAGPYFAVTFKLDVTFKPQSRRFTMEEVALYKVANGKIVYEEFFYSM